MKPGSIEIGKVDIPQGKEKWFKHVTKEGNVIASPPATGPKYTPSQRKAVDEATKKVRETFVSKAKKLRDNLADARKDLKKDLLNDKLRIALENANGQLSEFNKTRKTAEADAKREAREKALK